MGGDASTTPPASTSPGSVLTGKSGKAGPVLAVKIDNVAPARPATGLDQAAVVYAIQVEGGLSRLMAIYDTNHMPAVVGPVRSARETDLGILPQYGRPALAFSGAQSQLLPVLRAHPLIQDVRSGYFRSPGARQAPHNEYLRTAGLGGGVAKDIGFRFADQEPEGGRYGASAEANFQAAGFNFIYHSSDRRYHVWMDGDPSPWRTENVIIQDVKVSESQYRSRTGFVPYSETVGVGTAVIYRDGVAFDCSWRRDSETSGTHYFFQGESMKMKPGQTWIVLK